MSDTDRTLPREIGLPGAILIALGSIVGTGVFVSLGIAAGVAGSGILVAIVLAALVAGCNGLSSAQLSANHPVSGGTYEFGYRFLTPTLGFSAGWLFLLAKTASAATAALGLAGYLLRPLTSSGGGLRVAVAVVTVALITGIVWGGIRRSNVTNAVVVSVALLALTAFVVAGTPTVLAHGTSQFTPVIPQMDVGSGRLGTLLHATALIFVAFTGYGRVATLGEEVRQPARTIPLAIVTALVISMCLYLAVAAVAIGSVGAEGFAAATRETAAPLVVVASSFDIPLLRLFVSLGAVTAMLAVILNLELGISRVLLAMGRRGDMPRVFARMNSAGTSPYVAVGVTGIVVGALVLVGDISLTWSFSAFTILVYYTLTNLAALRLPAANRQYPRGVAALGLMACLTLAFWVEPAVWASGLTLLVVGAGWRALVQRAAR